MVFNGAFNMQKRKIKSKIMVFLMYTNSKLNKNLTQWFWWDYMGNVNEELRERYMELAGILKESREGTTKTLKTILHKFALQEGVKMINAKEYLDVLKGAGLVVFDRGKKNWKYVPEEEWDLFSINI